MKVHKVYAPDVLEDENGGYLYGLEEELESSEFGSIDYVEWFKTEEERDECIKLHNLEVIE